LENPDEQFKAALSQRYRIERELSGLLGRRVDLRTPQDLSPRFRDEVLRTAMTQYAA
jgi:predicted nucleotidyltransferase